MVCMSPIIPAVARRRVKVGQGASGKSGAGRRTGTIGDGRYHSTPSRRSSVDHIALVAFALTLAGPQTAATDPAKEFQSSLAHVRELVQRASFDKADQELKELLAKHADA